MVDFGSLQSNFKSYNIILNTAQCGKKLCKQIKGGWMEEVQVSTNGEKKGIENVGDIILCVVALIVIAFNVTFPFWR